MPKLTRLALLQLESRDTPTVVGLPWVDPTHLTLSLVPDGTLVGSAGSALSQQLSEQLPAGNWKLEVLRAFQTWAVHANLNVGLVADGGQPLGATGLVQGDARFGDIRVASVPLAPESVAVGTPFQPNGSTWSGDIVLNGGYDFGPGGYDLFSTLLHEAGHVFGLGESDATSSAMYHRYSGLRLELSPQDVVDLQSLYGPRRPDEFDARTPNDSIKRAAALRSPGTPTGGDITTLDDADFYRFAIAEDAAPGATFHVQVRTSCLSLLVPSLTVYDAVGNVVGEAAAVSPLGGDVSVAVPAVVPGGVYYARVGNATQSAFGVGSYLFVVTDQPAAKEKASAFLNVDNRNNDSLKTATWLTGRNAGGTGLNFGYQGSISDSADVDFYKVRAQATASPLELIALVSTEPGGLAPKVEVFDHDFRPVAARVVGNEPGVFSVQVLGATPDTDYYVKVDSLAPAGGPRSTGNYFLGVNFTAGQTVRLEAATSGTLTGERPQAAQALSVSRDAAMHFVLSADAGGSSAAQVQLTIFDKGGAVVFRLVAFAGQPATSGVAYLSVGEYRVQFLAVTRDSAALSVSYDLTSAVLTNPIGPTLVGTTTTTTTTTTDYYWVGTSYLVFDPVTTWIDPYYYY